MLKRFILSQDFYVGSSIHIFSLDNEGVDNSNVTLGGGSVDATSSTFVRHQQGHTLLK